MTRPLFFSVLLFAFIPFPAAAWGPLGHRLTADLAETGLTSQTRTEVATLLAGEADPTLAGIANWADNLRESDPVLGKRSARWHYVNIGESGCHYEPARDCPNGDCVVEAIRQQTTLLADRSQARKTRAQALKFVVHFIGDIHQPMHNGYAHDRGGNDFQINLDGKGSNLHSLWDSGLLKTRKLDEAQYLSLLQALPAPLATTPPILPPDSAHWAEQACRVVLQPGIYPARAKIDASYVEQALPVAESGLRLGGARLAEVLNAALGAP